MNNAHDGQAVLHIHIVDGVAAHQHAAGLNDLLRAAPHDLPQNVQIPALGEADNIHGGFHLAAHGVDITEGIGGRNLTEGVGILHHGREEVQGLDNAGFIIDFIDSSVIRAVKADQQIRIGIALGQLAQHMAQDTRPQLGCSPAAFTEDDFFSHFLCFLLIIH